MPDVFAVDNPGNTASAAVCARLDMTPLGSTDRYYGQTLDCFWLRPS